jgi:hypothetical protein
MVEKVNYVFNGSHLVEQTAESTKDEWVTYPEYACGFATIIPNS